MHEVFGDYIFVRSLCRITVRIVDHRGMTREQREAARRMTEQFKDQKGPSESRQN